MAALRKGGREPCLLDQVTGSERQWLFGVCHVIELMSLEQCFSALAVEFSVMEGVLCIVGVQKHP